MFTKRTAECVLAVVALLVLGGSAFAADIYVDAANCPGPGSGTLGDPYCTIQDALDAAAVGETVNVAAATYAERLTISQSVVLLGAQAGVDPTPGGARTIPAAESIVDFTGLARLNPNVEIQIANGVSDVTIDGFTLIGHPDELNSDESIIRVGSSAGTGNDRIAIANNIMTGWKPILFKGGNSDTLTVASNRMVANKNGLVVQVGVNDLTVSGNTFAGGAPIAGDPAAMQTTAVVGALIENNVASGFTGGRAWGGSNLNDLVFNGNDFNSNRDGINIFGDSSNITITDNNLSDNSRYGINIKAADLQVEGNLVLNNADAGINIADHVNASVNNVVSCNDLVGNTNNGLQSSAASSVLGENNWWGDASGPTHAGNPGGTGDAVSDDVDYDPWLAASSTTAAECQPVPLPGSSMWFLVLLAVLLLGGLLVLRRRPVAAA